MRPERTRPAGVDSMVHLPCFARNLLYAPGIIEAALGFLARLGGLIASDCDDRVDFHPSNEDPSLGTPNRGRASQCGGVPQ